MSAYISVFGAQLQTETILARLLAMTDTDRAGQVMCPKMEIYQVLEMLRELEQTLRAAWNEAPKYGTITIDKEGEPSYG